MKLILILFFIILSEQGHASTVEDRTTCSKAEGQTPFSWCLTKPEKPSSEVLYVLHGMGYDERIWIDEEESKTIRQEWNKSKRKEPWVITIDFPEEASPWALEDNLREVFVRTLMPTVEKEISSKILSRSLMGYSMNGFSVFQLWFKNPELFQKYAALCPAVTKPKVITNTFFEAIFNALVGSTPFQTPEARLELWNGHDPLVLAPKASSLTKSRPIFINYNEYDDYDFDSGVERFLKLNKKIKLNVTTIKAKESGHCENLDLKALSQFL